MSQARTPAPMTAAGPILRIAESRGPSAEFAFTLDGRAFLARTYDHAADLIAAGDDASLIRASRGRGYLEICQAP